LLLLTLLCTLQGIQGKDIQLQTAHKDEYRHEIEEVAVEEWDLKNVSVRQHCPDIADLPITNAEKNNFYAARKYTGKGHSIPDLSCNGNVYDELSGVRLAGTEGLGYPIGSLYVHAGCSFYGFEKIDYQGSYTQYDGPLFISEVPNTWGGLCSEIPCPGSFLVDCRMHMPDCIPSDSWATVASFDNSGSPLVSTFTYTYSIGTSWSTEMSEGFSISSTVTAEMKASFWGIFEAGLSVSETTGYDWSTTSSEAQNEEQQFSVETDVPGGSVIQIQQTKGTCGDSNVKTEMFRSIVTRQNGDVVIVEH